MWSLAFGRRKFLAETSSSSSSSSLKQRPSARIPSAYLSLCSWTRSEEGARGLADMPPAQKKQKKAAASTPKDAYFDRLDNVLKRTKCKGSMLVKGIQRDDSDDEEKEEEEVELTAAQVATLRHILINDSRDKVEAPTPRSFPPPPSRNMTVVVARVRRSQALKAGHSFASCGQDESDDDDDDIGLAFFNTSSGNQVVCGIPGEVRKALKKGTAAAQFDALFGLTHGLKSYDSWMHDNECWEKGGELEKAIKCLGKAWRDTLKKSDQELGIDAEFTRPGIESLLAQLEDDFEGCEASAEYPFKWRA